MINARVWSALVALALLTGCAGETPTADAPDLAALLPTPAMSGEWRAVEGPVEHAPATLYEYLDGGAERYLAYGFRELLHIRYQPGGDRLSGVTLDIYDMGGELGAFGIYAAGRPPGVDPMPWGAEGYRDGVVAAAWKGPVFVRGEADADRPELLAALEELIAGVCDRAPGPASPPAVLSLLPETGRLPWSERWVPADLLGHAFLPGGVTADYEIDGLRGELYFSDLGGEAAARDALAGLRANLEIAEDGSAVGPTVGDEAFDYADPILGTGTALRSGSLVAGVHGELSHEQRQQLLAELVRALGS